MPILAVNGTHLFYEDTGHGSTGETIVFSHGLLWNTELFAPQIAALRKRYRCIVWDHRGQGRSAADHRGSIGMELVWQDAVALLEKLAPGPVHFCGLSMGGFVGMRMASRRADLLRSLLLLETSADPEPEENLAKYRILALAARIVGPGPVASKVLPILFGKTFVHDPARQQDRERFTELLRGRQDIWRAVYGVIDRAGVYDELNRINLPTLVLVGDEDVTTTPAKAKRIHEAIQGSELMTIPHAGHSSSVEQPAAVTTAIEAFLGRLKS